METLEDLDSLIFHKLNLQEPQLINLGRKLTEDQFMLIIQFQERKENNLEIKDFNKEETSMETTENQIVDFKVKLSIFNKNYKIYIFS